MKNFLKDTIEWLAQKLIIQASHRAVQMMDQATIQADQAPLSLPAPKRPEIELH